VAGEVDRETDDLPALFARYGGQTENDSHDTGSDAPAAALGMAILLMEENDAVSDRLWGN
jgi:hypothetical protein